MNRIVRIAALALTTAAAALGLTTTTAAAAPSQFVYTGAARITVVQSGYCGFNAQPTPFSNRTFTAPVTLVVGAPAADGTSAERNPIHFTLQTNNQSAIGAWSITTGQVASTPSGRRLAVQYWTDQYNSSTGRLTGTLTEDHREEALAYNLINVEQMLIPCRPQLGTIPMVAAMGEGTQLGGTLTARQGALQVRGVSSDRLTQYDIVVNVQRSA